MSRPVTFPSPSTSEPSFSEMKLPLERDKLLLSSSNRILSKFIASPLDELIQSTRSLRLPQHDPHEPDLDLRANQTDTTSTTLTGGDPFFGESLMSMSYSYAISNSNRHCLANGDKKHGFYDSSLEASFFRGLNCSLGETQTEELMATTKRNPNKSLITISTSTAEVLTVNKHACRLWGVSSKELVGVPVTSLLSQNLSGIGASKMEFWDEVLSSKGEVVKINGKIMKALTAKGEVSVSVWLKRLPARSGDKNRENERAIIVIEPVELTMAVLQVDAHGKICDFEAWVPTLFGYENEKELTGQQLSLIIPSLNSPLEIPQTDDGVPVTGKTKSGTFFPLILDLMVAREFLDQGASVLLSLNALFPIAITVFRSVSGLVSLKENGTIYGCNHNFSSFIFGYGDVELRDEFITKVIPDFYEQVDLLDDEFALEQTNYSSIFDQTQGSDLFSASLISNTSNRMHVMRHIATPPLLNSSLTQTLNKNTSIHDTSHMSPSSRPTKINQLISQKMDDSPSDNSPTQPSISQRCSTPSFNPMDLSNSISDSITTPTIAAIPEGSFSTKALHKNGSQLAVDVQIRKVPLSGGKLLVCLWVSRVEDDQRAKIALNMSQSVKAQKSIEEEKTFSPQKYVPNNVAPESGEFIKRFIPLREIGSGAFGHVNLCRRIGIDEIVVVKFLCKSKVFQESWIEDKDLGRVPKEILVLSRLKHDKIVDLLEVYENLSYYQLVMRKHGDGMDLFDFIELHPLLDEILLSYIFRQIVDAVAYLHSCNVAHRDIKDENVIIDEDFNIRLIDFGSADFMEEGKLFATFCGTMEYCSPEILLGNKYYGPELEVWTMGIILYTMTFFENPYVDVEEAISGQLNLPFRVSAKLTQLIFQVLDPNPKSRASVTQLLANEWTYQPVDIKKYHFFAVMRGQAGHDTSSFIEAELPSDTTTPKISSRYQYVKSESC
ncbi:hypothetical protein LOD99_4637 [Oopsacas minuta]|uniref:Protein kinase domain-containing protein n=1 Tax=Oopsacas minuta TaxID=111878 RepID=A0AAV7JTK8_9METZ|nr:hypothetical protein LOD99_4637 [Oopsacas minuta]